MLFALETPPPFLSSVGMIWLTIQVDCTHWGVVMGLGGSSCSERYHKSLNVQLKLWNNDDTVLPSYFWAPCVLMIANGCSLSSTCPKLLSRCFFTEVLCCAKISVYSYSSKFQPIPQWFSKVRLYESEHQDSCLRFPSTFLHSLSCSHRPSHCLLSLTPLPYRYVILTEMSCLMSPVTGGAFREM